MIKLHKSVLSESSKISYGTAAIWLLSASHELKKAGSLRIETNELVFGLYFYLACCPSSDIRY